VPHADARAERRLEEGDAVTEILRVAEEAPADLIVLGTHGRTGLARLLMGSVAEQVVRRAPCPVLTVKAPLEGKETTRYVNEVMTRGVECMRPDASLTVLPHPSNEG
jgi:hypothetical protein